MHHAFIGIHYNEMKTLVLMTSIITLQCRQAKNDALSLLATCAEGYGVAPLQIHMTTIWEALKTELVAPAQEGIPDVDLLPLELLAESAARCLTRCIAVSFLLLKFPFTGPCFFATVK